LARPKFKNPAAVTGVARGQQTATSETKAHKPTAIYMHGMEMELELHLFLHAGCTSFATWLCVSDVVLLG
jgi:hypothetical protein